MTKIPYRDREKSFIVIKSLREPYGPGSGEVVSIGCTLKNDVENPTWKVHIPKDILPDVIESLQAL